MKRRLIQVVAALPGLLMLNNAVGLVLAPEGVLANLGMAYLDGIGRSTQIGDLGAFFACSAGFILYGAFMALPRWLMAGGAMLLVAAVYRLLATAVHGADLATLFIGIEVVAFIWLAITSRLLAGLPSDAIKT